MHSRIALLVAAAAVFGQASGHLQGSGPSRLTLIGNLAFSSSTAGWVEVSTSAGYGRYCGEAAHPPRACNRASTSVYGTSDGGRTWKRLLRFTSRPFVGQNLLPTVWLQRRNGGYRFVLAWAPGAHGGLAQDTLYRTADGGATWARLSLPFKLGYVADTDVAVIGDRNLWVLAHLGAAGGSEPVSVYRTRDAGTHWTKVAGAAFGSDTGPGSCGLRSGISVGGHKDDIVFADTTTGFVANNNGLGVPFLLATHDGGTHWQMEKVPLPRGVPAPNPKTSVFPYVTLHQARFFGKTGVLPVTGTICRGQRVNGHTNYECTDRFYALISRDGGRTWPVTRLFPAMSRKGLASLTWQIASEREWHATAGTNLWSTKDGGGHWTVVQMRVPHGFQILHLDFVARTHGWAIAGKPDVADGVAKATELVHTDDAGRTWSAISLPGAG
jgi:photosystem II stability/assembly factor-like uncharacterized protein